MDVFPAATRDAIARAQQHLARYGVGASDREVINDLLTALSAAETTIRESWRYAEMHADAEKRVAALLDERAEVIAALNAAGAPRERHEPNEHGRMHPRTVVEQIQLLAAQRDALKG